MDDKPSVSSDAAQSRKNDRRWTEAEDDLLRHWQNVHGNRWSIICKHIPGRSGQQCAQRWRHKGNPNISRARWTEEEDSRLAKLVGEHGHAWAQIARSLPGRTDQQCMGRWRRHLDPTIDAGPWKAWEDKLLAQLVEKHGTQWAVMSSDIPSRTAQQCRARWMFLKNDYHFAHPSGRSKRTTSVSPIPARQRKSRASPGREALEANLEIENIFCNSAPAGAKASKLNKMSKRERGAPRRPDLERRPLMETNAQRQPSDFKGGLQDGSASWGMPPSAYGLQPPLAPMHSVLEWSVPAQSNASFPALASAHPPEVVHPPQGNAQIPSTTLPNFFSQSQSLSMPQNSAAFIPFTSLAPFSYQFPWSMSDNSRLFMEQQGILPHPYPSAETPALASDLFGLNQPSLWSQRLLPSIPRSSPMESAVPLLHPPPATAMQQSAAWDKAPESAPGVRLGRQHSLGQSLRPRLAPRPRPRGLTLRRLKPGKIRSRTLGSASGIATGIGERVRSGKGQPPASVPSTAACQQAPDETQEVLRCTNILFFWMQLLLLQPMQPVLAKQLAAKTRMRQLYWLTATTFVLYCLPRCKAQ